MNEAIKLAIEKGGYQINRNYFNDDHIALDPLFWQALGKALGWEGATWLFTAQSYFHEILTRGDLDKFWKERL